MTFNGCFYIEKKADGSDTLIETGHPINIFPNDSRLVQYHEGKWWKEYSLIRVNPKEFKYSKVGENGSINSSQKTQPAKFHKIKSNFYIAQLANHVNFGSVNTIFVLFELFDDRAIAYSGFTKGDFLKNNRKLSKLLKPNPNKNNISTITDLKELISLFTYVIDIRDDPDIDKSTYLIYDYKNKRERARLDNDRAIKAMEKKAKEAKKKKADSKTENKKPYTPSDIVPHSHNNRVHEHKLPSTGIKHRHNNGHLGKSISQGVSHVTEPKRLKSKDSETKPKKKHITQSGIWKYKKENDLMTDEIKQFVYGFPTQHQGTKDKPYIRMGCYQRDMGVTLYWGNVLSEMYPNGEIDAVKVTVKFGQEAQ